MLSPPSADLSKVAKWPAVVALAAYALYITYRIIPGQVPSPGTAGVWGLVLILGGIGVGRWPGALFSTAYSTFLMLYLFWTVPEPFNLPSFIAGLAGYIVVGIGGGWTVEVVLTQRDQIRVMRRKSREDALHLEAALRSIADAVIAVDANGRVTFMNDAGSRLTGCSIEEAQGQALSEVFDAAGKATGESVADMVSRALDESPTRAPSTFMTFEPLDGSPIELEVEAAPIRNPDSGVRGIIMTFRDVTARRRADEALRLSESLNRSMLAAMPDIVMRVSRQGVYLDVITRDPRKLYVPVDQLVGSRVTDVLPAEPARRNLEAITEALETGETQVVEYGLTVMEGERHFESRVVPGGEDEAVAVIRDVTDRRKTEDALRESERQFRLLAENSRDLIYRIVLKPRLRFDYVSPSSEEFVGYTPQEHYDNPELGLALVHPDDLSTIRSVIDSGHDFDEPLELRWIRRDGSVIWTEHQMTPIYDEEGDLYALEGFARDVTERKDMEEELRRLSLHDQLTGLHNRRYCEAEMDRLNVPRQLPLGLVICDVNGLKQVNDTMGHAEGDRLLQRVASVIRETVRVEDIVARWGGDEFVIILPKTSISRVEDIGLALEKAADMEMGSARVGLAAGWATKEDAREGLEAVMRAAEEMMYQRKAIAKRKAGVAAHGPGGPPDE